MFIRFFYELKKARVPVSLREFLTLLEALTKGAGERTVEGFYYLSRAALVKDERHFDRFDQVFGHVFKGLQLNLQDPYAELPEEWLRKLAERLFTPEERALLKARGGWEQLMEELRKRLQEQNERHQGGSKWIGTAGTSPFGAYGYNPEGVRIGQDGSRHRRAVKVWDRREFRNFDDDVELGTRNMKVALRRLRKFVREGSQDELDLPATIQATARNGGLLDIRERAERKNNVKVLLLLDVGGSMDDHIRLVEQLFSAARTQFKHLEHFYFHNCVYEGLWKENRRRFEDQTPTYDVLHKYGSDYRLILVGDASMSPYEVLQNGGAVEHWNEESGHTWMSRLLTHYPKSVWLNPVPERAWGYTESIGMLKDLLEGRMYTLTLDGLDRAMQSLSG